VTGTSCRQATLYTSSFTGQASASTRIKTAMGALSAWVACP
jgi:hypothetical protein